MKINPNNLRKKVLKMVYEKKTGHIGGSFSIAEIVSLLYSNFDIGGKDRLILSKGHAVPIIYAVLHEIGKITDSALSQFREIDSPLQGHPDKVRFPFVDATTGSLGQGLSIAIGHAIGKSLKKEDGMVFCILGDGEIQEGQVWEALMYFPKTSLKNLICIIDWNKGQSDGFVTDIMPIYDNLKDKINCFGWDCRLVNGHSVIDMEKEIYSITNKPLCLILDTIKGKGVSFMEDPSWHSRIPTELEYNKALEELGA